MKMPSSVRVGPYDVKIRELDPSDAEKNYGLFHSEKMEIHLRKEFSSPQQICAVVRQNPDIVKFLQQALK